MAEEVRMREAYAVAARWWREQIGGRAKLDNGDRTKTGAMAFAMAALIQDQEPRLSDAQLEAFEAVLVEALVQMPDGAFVTLASDYGPDGTLHDAFVAAVGEPPSMTRFPWKTVMWIDAERGVRVSHGYRAPIETIWLTPTPPAGRP